MKVFDQILAISNNKNQTLLLSKMIKNSLLNYTNEFLLTKEGEKNYKKAEYTSYLQMKLSQNAFCPSPELSEILLEAYGLNFYRTFDFVNNNILKKPTVSIKDIDRHQSIGSTTGYLISFLFSSMINELSSSLPNSFTKCRITKILSK